MRYTAGLLCIVAALEITSCGGEVSQTEKPVPVTVIVPQPQVITSTVIVPCRLESATEALVTPLNPGRIVEVYVREGDSVSSGDILLELSTDQQYRGAVASSAARLQAARTLAGNSETNLQRARRLRVDGAISDAEFEMALSSQAAAEAALTQAWADYEGARSMSESGRILAPFGGTVTRVWAREGQISAGPLVSITDSGIMTSELLLADRHLPELSEGLPVVFTTSHYQGCLFSGEVSSFSSSVDPVSGLVAVKVQFPDTSGLLRSGMTGNAALATEVSEDAVVLPMRALLRDDEGSWMAALKQDGRARLVNIDGGIESGSMLEVTRGIEPGDSVIDMGHHIVTDGCAVEAVGQ
jgi:RND family efflux transporter MFP subunit